MNYAALSCLQVCRVFRCHSDTITQRKSSHILRVNLVGPSHLSDCLQAALLTSFLSTPPHVRHSSAPEINCFRSRGRRQLICCQSSAVCFLAGPAAAAAEAMHYAGCAGARSRTHGWLLPARAQFAYSAARAGHQNEPPAVGSGSEAAFGRAAATADLNPHPS